MNILLLAAVFGIFSCQKPAAEEPTLANPSSLKAEQLDLTSVRLAWTDNAEGETGYRIFRRGENDGYNVQPLATLGADATEFVFEGLVAGAEYDLGVQALSDDIRKHSEIVYLNDFKVLDREGLAGQEGGRKVAAPSDVAAVQVSGTSVTLSWVDNAQDEKGYNVYMREAAAEAFGEPVKILSADVQTCDIADLVMGTAYVFGIQAAGESVVNDSRIVSSEELLVRDLSKVPEVVSVKASFAYVAVTYKIQKLEGTNPEHGICFSAEGNPDVDDIKVYGPELKANTEILQVVPNAYLEDGKEYMMSVFVKDGELYSYSTPQKVKLDAQPEIPQFDWEKLEYAEAEGVEIYKTVSGLNGRTFNAWYAVADPSKVDFRVMYPETVGSKKTVEAQAEAAGDCLALINGAIYGNYNIGVIITEGEMTQQWHGEIEGCHWATDNQLYQLTRPIIGVDKDGKAGAYWVGVPQQGIFYYYDRPQANVVGQAKYPKVTATTPVAAVAWAPYFAISCGPMVLYDGKVAADNSMVDDVRYYTNYECWDESGVYSAHPDRSAVGVTEDGRIVLFICDGRITESQGAYMKELGPIMKSLGCVHAMNLDGGGSTGMWVKGAGMVNHLDGTNWRAVKSTLGFFTRK